MECFKFSALSKIFDGYFERGYIYNCISYNNGHTIKNIYNEHTLDKRQYLLNANTKIFSD